MNIRCDVTPYISKEEIRVPSSRSGLWNAPQSDGIVRCNKTIKKEVSPFIVLSSKMSTYSVSEVSRKLVLLTLFEILTFSVMVTWVVC